MRALRHNLRSHQHGDTIVEVLISIAVVSSVLSITYATMNRNLLTTRALQERTEASKYAQSQLEALKVYTDSNTVIPGGSFCLDGPTRVAVSPMPPANSSSDNFSEYPPLCIQQNLYNTAIVPDGSIAKLYHVYVRWAKIGVGGVEEVVISYKVAN